MSESKRPILPLIVFLAVLEPLALAGGFYLGATVFVDWLSLKKTEPSPFLLLQYWQMNRLPEAMFVPLMVSTVLSALLGFLPLIVVMLALILGKPKRELHSSARFANDMEIRQAGLLQTPKEQEKQKFPDILIGKHKGQYLRWFGNEFFELDAPTRSGKGVGIVIPNCLHYRDSMVVYDPKYENFLITAGFRQAHGQEVYLFNPAGVMPTSEENPDPKLKEMSPLISHCWNPYTYIRRDARFTYEELLKNNYWRVANGYDPLPEQEIRQPENAEPQEIRTAWNDFPPVISNGKLGDLKNEPEYPAAKAGDVVQSALLVDKLLKDDTVQEIKKLIGDNQPILVPIQSEEASGKNRIPHATAHALADKLGLQVDTDIVQSNAVKRTDTGIYHRYVAPPEFKGEVQAGKSYLIVDDTLSVGGTIATLKGYIENNGGKVIGSTVMTAHALKVDIPIQPNMLQSLQQKQGLNEYWKQEFGYGVDKLTQQEAGHLRKPTLEQIQERVQETRQNLSQNKELNHEQTTQSVETQQRPVHPAPEIDGARISGTETVWQGRGQVLQSVFQQPQPPRNEEVSPPTQAATSEKDVAVSFSEKENSMENENPQKHDLPEPEFRQPENERAPDFYDYNFEDLPKERPQVAQNPDPSPELADDEKISPVPPIHHQENQADEPEPELPNTIEYEAFQREIEPAEPEKTEFRQPENPSVAQTPPTTELETEEPKQEKTNLNALPPSRKNPKPIQVWIIQSQPICKVAWLLWTRNASA